MLPDKDMNFFCFLLLSIGLVQDTNFKTHHHGIVMCLLPLELN
jgi:hypothetical protein